MLRLTFSFCLPSSHSQNETDPVCHIFRCGVTPKQNAWLESAWQAHKKPVRLPRDVYHYALAEWHYRYCVIAAWGSGILKPRLYSDFFYECPEIWEFTRFDYVQDGDSDYGSYPVLYSVFCDVIIQDNENWGSFLVHIRVRSDTQFSLSWI